jgi:hypothetical protein
VAGSGVPAGVATNAHIHNNTYVVQPTLILNYVINT